MTGFFSTAGRDARLSFCPLPGRAGVPRPARTVNLRRVPISPRSQKHREQKEQRTMRTLRSLVAVSASFTAALASFAGAASAQVRHEYNYHNVQGQLSTRPLYPVGRADSVRRPGFNGRLWISRPIIGGMAEDYPLAWGDPGPAAYGADEYDGSTVHATIGQTDVAFSPWEHVQGRGNKSLAMSRNKWLRDHGCTGGVRTFVNDLFSHYYTTSGQRVSMAQAEAQDPPQQEQGGVQPRATIHIPLDQPRFRSRMQVNTGSTAIVKFANADNTLRVSWPDAAPAELRARSVLTAATPRPDLFTPPIRVITSNRAIATIAAAPNSSEQASELLPSSEPAPVVSNAEVK